MTLAPVFLGSCLHRCPSCAQLIDDKSDSAGKCGCGTAYCSAQCRALDKSLHSVVCEPWRVLLSTLPASDLENCEAMCGVRLAFCAAARMQCGAGNNDAPIPSEHVCGSAAFVESEFLAHCPPLPLIETDSNDSAMGRVNAALLSASSVSSEQQQQKQQQLARFAESALSCHQRLRCRAFWVSLEHAIRAHYSHRIHDLAHSCAPNTVRYWDHRGVLSLVALADIAPADAVSQCYIQFLMTNNYADRCEILGRVYNTACTCERCVQEKAFSTSAAYRSWKMAHLCQWPRCRKVFVGGRTFAPPQCMQHYFFCSCASLEKADPKRAELVAYNVSSRTFELQPAVAALIEGSFRAFDRDQDGRLSRDEMVAWVKHTNGIEASDSLLLSLLEAADKVSPRSSDAFSLELPGYVYLFTLGALGNPSSATAELATLANVRA